MWASSSIPLSGFITTALGANGNTTFNGQQNVYDFENRLVKRGGVSIVYDGDGNRVQETVAGVTTKYLVGEVNPTGYVQVFAELSGTNSLVRGYMWGLQLEAVRDFTVNSFGIFHYYGFDGHGSVRWLTNASGVITDTYDYDAFGNLISSTGTTFNNYLFAGELIRRVRSLVLTSELVAKVTKAMALISGASPLLQELQTFNLNI